MNAEDEPTPFLSGPKGESLFWQLDWWCFDPDRIKPALVDPIYGVVTHLRQDMQDRLLVLLGAMLVENAVDAILSATMPDFDQLLKRREVTFSVKTDIVRTMRLCPASLLAAADIVRKIRNDCAHDLSIDSFAKMPKEMQALRQALTNIGHQRRLDKTDAECFDSLVSLLVGALWLYADRIRIAFDFIRSEAFMAVFKADCDSRFVPKWAATEELKKLYELFSTL